MNWRRVFLSVGIISLCLACVGWATEVDLQACLNLDGTWMYQNMPASTNSNLTATASIVSDPAGNSSYTYDWEFILPDDVSIAPAVTYGGGPTDESCNFAAPSANQPQGLSDSGQAVTVRVTVTGDDYGNTGSAEAEFGIALLGDVNNDGTVNVADRSIINAFWQTGSAGGFTLRDCDLNCDDTVNIDDRSIANAVWRGALGQNSVSRPCPLRPSKSRGVFWVDAAAAGNPEQIGTPDKPFATIQAGIDAAVDGYTVRVLPGLYEETIDFLGKAITVTSYEATMDNPAIISGTGNNAVKFHNGETSASIIEGFVITSSSGRRGIKCHTNSSPTIRNNVIAGCGNDDSYESEGTAIWVASGCAPIIICNTITGNYGSEWSEKAVSIDNRYGSFEGLISHCIIYGNSADFLNRGPGFLEPGRIRYCDIGNINDNADWLEGAEVDEYGNFSEPPMFVRSAFEPGGYDGDYHLKVTSPCINSGDLCYVPWEGATDFDNQGRIILGRVDVGADEVAPYTKVTKPTGGEVWAAESSHEIMWESFSVGDVDILYSSNGGSDWEMIESDLANTGSYDWDLATVDSDECVVWVSASEEPSDIECENSGVFTIHPSPSGPPVSSLWPTLGRDSKRSGLSNDPGPVVGCVKWQFETGDSVFSSVAVGADGRVHIASEDGKLYTVDPNDGTAIWIFDMNSSVTSSPTVGADGTVYVGCMNDKLYAIDKDGNLRWTHTTDSFIYSTAAVADDGKVFVGSQDGVLYALGADGSEIWSYDTAGPGQLGGAILASPATGLDGSVYVAGVYEPNLYALDPNDGTIRWVCDAMAGDGAFASPVVGADGTIYMALLNDTNLYAIDSDDGSIIWATDLADTASGWFGTDYEENYPDASCWSEPAIGPDGTIYVSFDDPYLRAINPDGTIKWAKRIGIIGGFTLAVGGDGLIYAACEDRSLYVLGTDGQVLAHFDGSDWLSQPVITALNTIIVSDADNVVWAINIDDCTGQSADLHRPGDVNADWAVDTDDLVLVAISWLEFDDQNWYPAADANRDLYINLADVAVLTNWWLIEE